MEIFHQFLPIEFQVETDDFQKRFNDARTFDARCHVFHRITAYYFHLTAEPVLLVPVLARVSAIS